MSLTGEPTQVADSLEQSERVAKRHALAWRFAIWGGLFTGACIALVLVLPGAAYGKDDVQLAIAVIVMFDALCVLLLPAIVAGLSQRRAMLMGSVPLLMVLLLVFGTEAMILRVYPSRDNVFRAAVSGAPEWYWFLFYALLIWMVTAGPVSVWRWVAGKIAKRRQVQAERKLAAIDVIEGSWPPKPRS